MTTQTTALKPVDRIKSLAKSENIKARFEEMLGKRAPAFISSVISAVTNNQQLAECEPMSVFSSAAVAASMDLPINQSLGFAHIVPYKGVAQFQIGWKGFVQLAMRTGQYKTINAAVIYEGQIKDENPFTGEMEFQKERSSEKIIGYLLYFKLLNGFEKYFYMTREEIESHAQRYSSAYKYDLREKKRSSQWSSDFDAMGLKTVVKMGLSKYGVLSIEMQKAIEVDQAELTPEGGVARYPDAVAAEVVEEPAPAKPAATKPSRLKQAVAQQQTEPPAQQAAPQQGQEEAPI